MAGLDGMERERERARERKNQFPPLITLPWSLMSFSPQPCRRCLQASVLLALSVFVSFQLLRRRTSSVKGPMVLWCFMWQHPQLSRNFARIYGSWNSATLHVPLRPPGVLEGPLTSGDSHDRRQKWSLLMSIRGIAQALLQEPHPFLRRNSRGSGSSSFGFQRNGRNMSIWLSKSVNIHGVSWLINQKYMVKSMFQSQNPSLVTTSRPRSWHDAWRVTPGYPVWLNKDNSSAATSASISWPLWEWPVKVKFEWIRSKFHKLGIMGIFWY